MRTQKRFNGQELSEDNMHMFNKKFCMTKQPINEKSWIKKHIHFNLNDVLLNLNHDSDNKHIPAPIPKIGDLVEVVFSHESFMFEADDIDSWVDNLICIQNDDVGSLGIVTKIQCGKNPEQDNAEALAFVCFMQDKGEYLIALEGELKVIAS